MQMYLDHFYSINKTKVKYLFEMARHFRLDLNGLQYSLGGQSTRHTHHVRLKFEPSVHSPLINGGILLTK